MVSKTALDNYGALKRDRLVSTLVSRRPKSCGDFAGDFIIDGQHKAIMHYCSGTETAESVTWLPCQVKIWPLDMSIVEIRKGEARLFNDNNLMRKKPTKVDTYRSGAFFGDPEALLMVKYLINLNLVIDNFGSTDEKAVELYTPNPFFYTILHDLQDNGFGINQAQAGLALYKKIYDPSKIHGQCFRTMVLLEDFMQNGLADKRQEKFKEWVLADIGGLRQAYKDTTLVSGFGGFNGNRQILHEHIIYRYNEDMINTNFRGLTLGPKTLAQAASINPKFAKLEV